MSEQTQNHSHPQSQIIVGVLGIFVLLIVALLLALWESNQYYQPEQINQFVQEQAELN